MEPHNGNPYAALHRSKSLSEVERLKLIVAKQEVEIARLKKGYWVEGAGANREYVTGREKTTTLHLFGIDSEQINDIIKSEISKLTGIQTVQHFEV